MKRILATFAAAALSAAASAALPIGGLEFNPNLNGSGLPGTGGPFFTLGAPSWLAPGNLYSSLSSTIEGIPGFAQFEGTVDSAAYYLNGMDTSGGLGVVYRINLANNSASNLVRAALKQAEWALIDVALAGSDSSGNSSSLSGPVTWTNGDPYFIERDAFSGAPQWAFRIGVNGTDLDAGETSALVWFETDATEKMEGSIALLDGGAAGAARVIGIPEPTTLAGLGLLGLVAVRRR